MDPAQWREETERVSIKLKNLNSISHLGGDWMDHLSMLKEYIQKSNFDSNIVENNTNKENDHLGMNRNGNNSIPLSKRSDVNDTSIIENLKNLKLEISNNLKSINRSENMINSKEKSIPLSMEYSVHSKVSYAFLI
jgi:hypothetical protein